MSGKRINYLDLDGEQSICSVIATVRKTATITPQFVTCKDKDRKVLNVTIHSSDLKAMWNALRGIGLSFSVEEPSDVNIKKIIIIYKED